MRNTLFAAAAAFALILGTAPTFAAESNTNASQAQPAQQAQPQAQQSNSGSGVEKCGAILADKSSHSDAEIAACQKQ